MKKLILRTTLASSLLLGGVTAFAQPGGEQNEAHEKCSDKRGHNLSPEQKAAWKAKRAERRQKFESMTPEQKSAWKSKRAERRAQKLANMTPEQRAKYETRRAKREAEREARRGI